MASFFPDLPYREVSGGDRQKHHLDLYLPEGRNWPVLVFVHGGGWNSGDRKYAVAGVDPYAGIGRFYAAHGVGTAVISYRLLPHVAWRGQIQDVAGAAAWVHRNIASYGGDPKRLFLAGHSAGAQLAARVALDPEPLQSEGLSKTIVSGVIAVSGSAYELDPERSDILRGGRRAYFERRFAQGDTTGAWIREVSLLRFIDGNAPPFLIFYGSSEPKVFRQQSEMLADRLKSAGVPATLVVVPHRDHVQTVMMLTQAEGVALTAVLEFVLGRKTD